MKKLLTIVLMLSMVVSLIGCAATPEPQKDTAAKSETTDTVKNDSDTKDDTAKDDEAPEEPVTINVVLPGPAHEEDFYITKLEEFEQANSDIKVNLMFTPNDSEAYGNAIQLMYTGDEGLPDIFRVSGSLPTSMLVSFEKGWVRPLDEFITEDLKGNYPEGSFTPSGGLMLEGNIYGIPLIANQFPAFRPFIYNMDILNAYGYTEPAKTWAELEEMLTAITEGGNGKEFGMGIVGGNAASAFYMLGETIKTRVVDAHLTEGNFVFNVDTGKSEAANEGLIASSEFIKNLHKSDLLLPGYETANADTLIQSFAMGQVAVVAGQAWYPPRILEANPNANLKVSMPPKRNESDNGHRYIYAPVDPYYAISSDCENPDEAWRVLEFISSVEFQMDFYETQGRVTVSYNSYAPGTMPDFMIDNMANADEFLRVAPNPIDIHPDANVLISKIMSNGPKPALKDLFMVSIIEDVSFESLAKTYDEQMNIVVDEQVAEMQAEGSDITRDALIYPSDWNQDENYFK